MADLTHLQYAFPPLEVSYAHTFGISTNSLWRSVATHLKLNLQSPLMWISEFFREATQRCPECPVGTDMERHTTGWSPPGLSAQRPGDDELLAAAFDRLPPGQRQPARTGLCLAAASHTPQCHPCAAEGVTMTDVCESSRRFYNAGLRTRP